MSVFFSTVRLGARVLRAAVGHADFKKITGKITAAGLLVVLLIDDDARLPGGCIHGLGAIFLNKKKYIQEVALKKYSREVVSYF